MGYYIQVNHNLGKANQIVEAIEAAEHVSFEEAKATFNPTDEPKIAAIVVVQNGAFDAAAFAFSKQEFEAFHTPDDYRPKTYITMPWSTAVRLTGYRERT